MVYVRYMFQLTNRYPNLVYNQIVHIIHSQHYLPFAVSLDQSNKQKNEKFVSCLTVTTFLATCGDIQREKFTIYQLLQLCTARTVFSILVTERLYTVMAEVCRWLTNEKQRKTNRRVTEQ